MIRDYFIALLTFVGGPMLAVFLGALIRRPNIQDVV